MAGLDPASHPFRKMMDARASPPMTTDKTEDHVTSFALVLSSNTLISGGLPDSPSSAQRETT
jgi:hypothetical protein